MVILKSDLARTIAAVMTLVIDDAELAGSYAVDLLLAMDDIGIG